MNTFTIIGNSIKDLKDINASVTMAAGTVAEEQYIKGKNESFFWDFIVFGDTAERMKKAVQKGTKISVTGQLQYSDKDGKRYTTLVVDRFDIVKGTGGGSKAAGQTEKIGPVDEEDQIPF